MARVLELLGSFPTVGFTALLAFTLAWWLVSILVSGIDGDGDIDADADADLDADVDADLDGDGEGLARAARALHMGSVPLSLGLTVGAFGAWSTSLLCALVIDRWPSPWRLVAGLVVIAMAVVAGGALLRGFARISQPLFRTELAPRRHAAIGAVCRIRTLEVSHRMGQAEVLAGPLKGAVVSIRPAEGELDLSRGDIAHVVDYDEDRQVYLVVEVRDGLIDPRDRT